MYGFDGLCLPLDKDFFGWNSCLGRELVTEVRLSFVLACLLIWVAAPAAAQLPAAGWARVELPETGTYAWRYLPGPARDAAGRGERLPCVLFLHGSGASPEGWRPFLQQPADAAGVVVIAPAPADPLGWGIAQDLATLDEAVDRVAADLPLDRRRIGLAGHSSGGAYAFFLAYETRERYSGVFSFSAPFRHVLEPADPEYVPPLRLWYGGDDPNYLGGHLTAIAAMMEHRGVPWEAEVVPGLGHSSIRQQDLVAGFEFLAAQRRPGHNRLQPKRTAKGLPRLPKPRRPAPPPPHE